MSQTRSPAPRRPQQASEAVRLESLWSGDFGRAYLERNAGAGAGRRRFWQQLYQRQRAGRTLEVGCNIGANLQWISRLIHPREVYGVDISETALEAIHSRLPGINALWAPARELPFRDQWFDLVFTAGVLIHQPDESLPRVMSELVRCSKRLVLCLEYYAPRTVEVPYRGRRGALFKRNYGRIYQQLFPELRLVQTGRLTRKQGWDNVTFWLFSK